VDQVITVLAAQAPELPQALERALAEGAAFVILDGTVVPADRCREKTISVSGEATGLWYSGKIHCHSGNVQAVAPSRRSGRRVPAGSALKAITPRKAASFGVTGSGCAPLDVDEHQGGPAEPGPLSAITPGSRRQPFHRVPGAAGRAAVVTSGPGLPQLTGAVPG
jgi:hypothetical protein